MDALTGGMQAQGPAVVVRCPLGRPVFTAGCIPWGMAQNATAWCLRHGNTGGLSPFWLRDMVRTYLRQWAGLYEWTRIDTTVLSGWRPGRVLATACGFVFEGRMERWGPEDAAYDLYRWEP